MSLHGDASGGVLTQDSATVEKAKTLNLISEERNARGIPAVNFLVRAFFRMQARSPCFANLGQRRNVPWTAGY
jgi:hypothetical protein